MIRVIKLSLISSIIASYLVVERQRLVITKLELKSDKIEKDMTIVQLSDLHGHVFWPHNYRLVRQIKQQKPDAICLTGDLITASKSSSERVLKLLDDLALDCPIFYIRGNHELAISMYVDWMTDYEHALQQRGVTILENEKVTLNGISIYGMEVPLSAYQYVPSPIMKKLGVRNQSYKSLTPTPDEFSLLLSHTPLIEDILASKTFDVILTGHMHGGIVRLPKVGGLLSPERRFFPKYSGGIYEVFDSTLVVNRGLGCGMSMPLRVNNPPEIVALTLRKQDLNNVSS